MKMFAVKPAKNACVSAPKSVRRWPQSEKSSLGMACVMPVNALRQQTFTAALAPSRERGATTFGPHTSAKAVLAFARSFGWLIGAFHKP
jgi:hypothetical protein